MTLICLGVNYISLLFKWRKRRESYGFKDKKDKSDSELEKEAQQGEFEGGSEAYSEESGDIKGPGRKRCILV